MADIRLSKVPSGTNQNIACTPDSRFVFDFPTAEATMTRSGDNLVFTFDDGGSIELTGFYTTYNSERMPDFEVDGATISGADFFTAMNEPDLMPAAGPAAGAASNGARYHEYANSSLMDGIDRLGGLDLGFGRAEEPADDLSGLGMDDGNALLTAENYGGSIPAAEPEPNVPGNPDDNPNHGVTITPGITGAEHTVHEKHLADGTAADGDLLTARGSLNVSAPDGIASITVQFGEAQVEVPVNGASVSFSPEGHSEGVLDLRYNADAGTLEYSYTLKQATQEHAQEGQNESLSHDFTVTVTDTDGDSESSVIRINIEDDAPTLQLEQTGSGEYGKESVIGVLSRNYGADGEAAEGSLSLLLDGKAASRTEDGVFAFDDIGTIRIDANGDIVFRPFVGSGAGASHTLGVTITDGDNDPATDEITFSVTGTDISNLTGHAESSDADRNSPHAVAVEGLPEGAVLVDGTYEGVYGTITVKDGAISYIQDKKTFEHSVKGEEGEGKDIAKDADQVSVSVKLGDGSEANFTVSVDITDDVPYGGSVSHAVVRGSVIEGNIFDPASGNPATAGADGLARVEWKLPDGWKWTDDSSDGSGKAYCEAYPDAQLSVTLNSDGTYAFTVLGNVGDLDKASIAFDHIIYDRDGDWSEGKLDFNPSAEKDISPLPTELEVTVSEAALPDGSQPSLDEDGNPSGSGVRLEIPAGYTVTEGGKGTYGHVVKHEDGSWSYELITPVSNVLPMDGDAGQDTVTLTLTDAQGIEHKVDVKVTILDDAPVITGAEEAQVEPVTETLFPDGSFDFTFGNHDEFAKHNNTMLGHVQDTGWQVIYGDKYEPLFAEHTSGLRVSGGMYTYAERQDGYMELSCDKSLEVFYSASGEKYGDHESVSQGKQDGLTVGEVETWADKSYSQFEIGAAPNENMAEGICFDLQGQIAHSVTVNLGAFFSAGSGNDWGQTYDPIPERALLTFYDDNGKIVKQMQVQADSSDGQYTQSIDCYVAGGFTKFVVSALDNVKWANDHGIEYNGNADSDFVVQSVEFHKIIGTATGKLDVTPGADGLNSAMNEYPVLFDLDAMKSALEEQGLTLVPDGDAGFLARAKDNTLIFAAEIDRNGEWTLTQFNHFDGDQQIELKFYTQDGDGDRQQTGVKVNLYQGAESEGQAVAHDGAADSDDFLHGLGNTLPEDDAGNGLFDDAGDDLIFYDKSDYLVQGGSGIDFLLSGKNDDLHLNDILANTDTNDGPLVSGVEVLLKGDEIAALTSVQSLREYGIEVEGDRLILGEGWTASDDGGCYTNGNGSLILETTLNDPTVAEDGKIVFENPPRTDELFSEDPYAIPEETPNLAALFSFDEDEGMAMFPKEWDALQQGEASVRGENAGSGMTFADGNNNVAEQDGPDALSLDLTNMDTSACSGLDAERGENGAPARADSALPVAEGMDQGACHENDPAGDLANEEAMRAAITTMQTDTGGC